MIEEGECLALYRRMKLVRSFDDKADEIFRMGRLAGHRQIYAGEEAACVGAIHALARGDIVVSTYHEYGHRLARGADPRAAMAELMGVESELVSRTDSAPAIEDRTLFIGANGASGLAIAGGLALALNYKSEPAMVCCIFGDEALAQGAFHQALNLASISNLPIVFICENNFYGMGTFIDNTVCQEELYRVADMYKMPGVRVDGMDVIAVYAATIDTARRAREGDGPSLIEAVTYRYRSSAFSDAADYDTRREEPIWRERDPILNLRARLIAENALAEPELDRIDREVGAAIDDAVKFAQAILEGSKSDTVKN